jgi:glycyl-tRNA synthetase beta subunit
LLHAQTLLSNNQPVVLMKGMDNFSGGDFSLRSPEDLAYDCTYSVIHLLSQIPKRSDFISLAWIPGGVVNEHGGTDYGKFSQGFDIELFATSNVRPDLIAFLADRLKVQQREAGVRHDLIDAVFALGGEDDLVRLLARVKALQAFVATQEGADLLAGYKRAANILKSSGDAKGTVPSEAPWTVPGGAVEGSARNGTVPKEGQSPAEVQLLTALNTAEPLAASAIAAEQFEDAMAALASLRAPIDAFFDGVMVNDPDPEKRAFRVGLLTRFRDAVCQVADFSRIEG